MQSVNISVTKGDKALGGLLRDIVELQKDSRDPAVSDKEFWDRTKIVLESIEEAYPA